MGKRSKEVQVGITVILSVVVLTAGMLWLKQFRFSGGMNRYQVDFPMVDGLQTRDRVQVRGMRMGKVADFDIIDDHVRVAIDVDRSVTLREDAQIRLSTIGIVGEKIVEIQPGTGQPVAEGHVFQGVAEPSLTTMGASASQTMDTLAELARDLRDLVRELRAGNHLTGTLTAAQGALEEVDGALGENREQVKALLGDLRAATNALRTTLAGPDSALAGTLGQARRTAVRADSVLAAVEKTAATLDKLMAGLDRGEGSAGKLLHDDRLYEEATATLADVRELIKDFRRNPRRYIKMSVIDF